MVSPNPPGGVLDGARWTHPLTWLFQRYIEAPSHRLARRTGALASARFAQWSERRRPTRPADHSKRG